MGKMAASSSGFSQSSAKFCSNCAFPLEKRFCFCPKCGNEVKRVNDVGEDKQANHEKPSGNASNAGKFSLPSFSLPSFAAFKATKEKERQNSFSTNSTRTKNKKRKTKDQQVTIQVGVMDEFFKVKRGETIPLKLATSSTADVILAAAMKTHSDFNKRFDDGGNYALVFKDGSCVEFIPGTDPPELFTLERYKEVSGYGYSRIFLYLSPDINATESISSGGSEDERYEFPTVPWLKASTSTQGK